MPFFLILFQTISSLNNAKLIISDADLKLKIVSCFSQRSVDVFGYHRRIITLIFDMMNVCMCVCVCLYKYLYDLREFPVRVIILSEKRKIYNFAYT